MEWYYYVIMGLLQGLTEWLPVSSSGHLVLAQEFFNAEERTLFDAILHLGTLVAAFVYFYKDIRLMLKIKNGVAAKAFVASIPIILFGFFFADAIEAAFSNTYLVCCLLIVNGIILQLHWFKWDDSKEIDPKKTVLIGLVQVLAILPGISRSGTTITYARVLGISWKDAAKFSFFISFLPILGAACYKIFTAYDEFDPMYLIGFIVAGAVGFATIHLMMKLLEKGKFQYFGIYTITAGVMMLIYLLVCG